MDSGGNIDVAEYSGQRVQKFSPVGVLLQEIGGGRGSAAGQFEFPSDVASTDPTTSTWLTARTTGCRSSARTAPSPTRGAALARAMGSSWQSPGSSPARRRRLRRRLQQPPNSEVHDGWRLPGHVWRHRRVQPPRRRRGAGRQRLRRGPVRPGRPPVARGRRRLDAPTLGETANARAVRGKVLVGIPAKGARAAQKGVRFVPLEQAREIPIGSFLDTRKGHRRAHAPRATGRARSSRAVSAPAVPGAPVAQAQAKGLTELRMKGSAAGFKRCGRNARASALSRRAIRRLRANAKGPLPHPRPPLGGDRPRHHLDHGGPLRRHPHHRQARQGRRARLPPQEDDHRARPGRVISPGPPRLGHTMAANADRGPGDGRSIENPDRGRLT